MAYIVTRVTSGGTLEIQMDGQRAVFAVGLKDPDELDPNSPAYMSAEELAANPTGTRWSEMLEDAIVTILQEDPETEAHFTFDLVV